MIDIVSEIRASIGERLLSNRTLSPNEIQSNLLKLFVDRTKIDTSFRRLMTHDEPTPNYHNCLELNDAKHIQFNQGFKANNNVFDEERQIWVDDCVDLVDDDLFIPRDDSK